MSVASSSDLNLLSIHFTVIGGKTVRGRKIFCSWVCGPWGFQVLGSPSAFVTHTFGTSYAYFILLLASSDGLSKRHVLCDTSACTRFSAIFHVAVVSWWPRSQQSHGNDTATSGQCAQFSYGMWQRFIARQCRFALHDVVLAQLASRSRTQDIHLNGIVCVLGGPKGKAAACKSSPLGHFLQWIVLRSIIGVETSHCRRYRHRKECDPTSMSMPPSSAPNQTLVAFSSSAPRTPGVSQTHDILQLALPTQFLVALHIVACHNPPSPHLPFSNFPPHCPRSLTVVLYQPRFIEAVSRRTVVGPTQKLP